MSDIARPLYTDEQIRQFLDVIKFSEYISEKSNRDYAFEGATNADWMLSRAITSIKEVNRELPNIIKYNTFDSKKYRSAPYKTDKQRRGLYDEILGELTGEERLLEDDKIQLGKGGMLPLTGNPKNERKAFLLIGLPASGKSTIAGKICDAYGAVLIDSDFVKRKIPEFFTVNGASLVHKESKFLNEKLIKIAVDGGTNIVLPTIGNDYDGVKGIIQNFKKNNYQVSVILVELDRILATQRAFGRFMHTRRYIPLSKILDTYANDPSLVFYRLWHDKLTNNIPMVLIDTSVPFGEKPKIKMERKFKEIHNII